MNRTDGERKELADWSSDRDLWRRSCRTDAPEDEVARFLDLAAFADGLLEPDEHDRVAALLADDPAAADDVAAAQRLHGEALPGGLERIIARACAIVPDELQLARCRRLFRRRGNGVSCTAWRSGGASPQRSSWRAGSALPWAAMCRARSGARFLRARPVSCPSCSTPGAVFCAISVRLRGRDIRLDGGARRHAASSLMGGVDAIPGAEFVLCRRSIVDPFPGACAAGEPGGAAAAGRGGARTRSAAKAGLRAITPRPCARTCSRCVRR